MGVNDKQPPAKEYIMAVMTLYPYLLGDLKYPLWVFDDEAHGLKAEAFVQGMSEMITMLLLDKGVPKSPDGFALSFSDQPFDHDIELFWAEEQGFSWEVEDPKTKVKTKHELNGNWYVGHVGGEVMEGWLCPALLKYFSKAPEKLYVKAAPLPEGIDPIWHDAKKGEHFVSGGCTLGGETYTL